MSDKIKKELEMKLWGGLKRYMGWVGVGAAAVGGVFMTTAIGGTAGILLGGHGGDALVYFLPRLLIIGILSGMFVLSHVAWHICKKFEEEAEKREDVGPAALPGEDLATTMFRSQRATNKLVRRLYEVQGLPWDTSVDDGSDKEPQK